MGGNASGHIDYAIDARSQVKFSVKCQRFMRTASGRLSDFCRFGLGRRQQHESIDRSGRSQRNHDNNASVKEGQVI
jgi:hypothetical protein